MGLKNPFRRNKARGDAEALHLAHNPWWAWGPLGLFWFGSSANDTNIDAGQMHHHGDGGGFGGPIDPGAGMGGGFDGGAGGGF